MSRAKKTKASKRRSAINLYRHIGEALNRAKPKVNRHQQKADDDWEQWAIKKARR